MSSEVLVSTPYFDSRHVSLHGSLPPRSPETMVKENMYTSSGYGSAKYNPNEWMVNNYSTLQRAVTDRDNAERIRHESKTLYKEKEAGTLHSQAEGTRHLGERLQDIHYWKSELQRYIEKLTVETELILGQKRRLEKALDVTDIPLAIATDNLSCRERRLGPDLVKDNVEEELLKEVELIKNIQALLKRTLSHAINQIRSNRAAKQTLEMDWSDKFQAYNMDDQCGRYNSASMDTQHHPNSAMFQEHVSNHESWVKFTLGNIALAEREEQGSAELRLLAERVLLETAEDLQAQGSAVNRALACHCQEVSEIKAQLELHLAHVLEQIWAQEHNIGALLQALNDKEAPMRVAQARLYRRSQRPNMELCRDRPQLSLVEEVEEISCTMEALRQQLDEARRSLGSLEETRLALEKDVGCKAHSLLIDREKCMTHRMRYPSVIALSGY